MGGGRGGNGDGELDRQLDNIRIDIKGQINRQMALSSHFQIFQLIGVNEI